MPLFFLFLLYILFCIFGFIVNLISLHFLILKKIMNVLIRFILTFLLISVNIINIIKSIIKYFWNILDVSCCMKSVYFSWCSNYISVANLMQGISQGNHYDLFIFNRHARFQLIMMLLPLKIAKRLLNSIFTYICTYSC